MLLNTCRSNPHDLEVAAVPETRHAFSRALNAGRRGLGDDPLDAAGTAPALDAAAEAIVDLLCAQRLSRDAVTTFRISWSLKVLHEQTIIRL